MSDDVVIIGAGASGMTCAAMLQRHGLSSTILERSDSVASAWRTRPDNLRLTGGRRTSTLPWSKFPHTAGIFPTRSELIEYLEHYAASKHLTIRTGVLAHRIERDDDQWRIDTTTGPVSARYVIVATGVFAVPHVPDWPGADLAASRMIHSSGYRNPAPFAGRDVLIIGAGTTAMEIAGELEAAGARSVQMAVRTPPNIVPRIIGALPGVKLLLRLPARIGDAQMRVIRRISIGDLTEFGLPVPPDGPFSLLKQRHTDPGIIDTATLRGIRSRRIVIVPTVERLDEAGAYLIDGSYIQVDNIIAATGFRPGLEPLVGHLGILDRRGVPSPDALRQYPGLHFTGFESVPGQLAFCADSAGRITKAITADLKRSHAA